LTAPVVDGADRAAPADPRPFYVVSDVHLGVVPAATERAFRAFLAHVAGDASGLLINGDLFDVWLATRHFVVSHHVRVLAAVADVVDAGVPVYFVGGNHDAQEFGGAMLRDVLGVTLLEEPARMTLGGRRALVMHGDGVWPAPRGYPAYRKRHPVLRSRAFRFAAERLAHVDRIYDRVAAWSGTRKFVARHARGESTGPKPSAAPIEAWARAALAAEPDLDLVLAGHSHLPAFVEVAPGQFYVNTGDWIEHMTYAVLPPGSGAPELRTWPVDRT
jgi:UDP-2,3-diacylglucosamine hydrolase